ncbi:MAG: FABP family protein [Acidimicrobiaceae bacterium]|nr:FABP family protein [Acidimicrobiaceae bacterium]MXZ98212.1 FABP family protein [Acidimicrobiaceae bacterium]MYE76540.1 FABP family protein [Acidimicrobiaceae bacterium]MYH43158.1 FABP family protein [Acidimicrobiaceae bacterium]MYI55109.1 FABP family protein [Acidimicrobiaceae bacterium]
MVEMHPLCEPLAPLLGTWRGRGRGSYPTIDDFAYTEELVFSHVGKPFLSMGQRTRDGSTGQPLHAEAGYLRALPDGAVELTVAQPSGVVEVDVGSVTETSDGLVVELESAEVGLTSTAKSVTAVRRRLEVTGSTLISELWMAAVGEADLIHHVRAELSQ